MEKTTEKLDEEGLMRMTTDVVSAYVGNHSLPRAQLAELIGAVYSSLKGLDESPPEPKIEPAKPAVSIKKSITPDYLVCLEDGKKLKMLKRHLRTAYNMSPAAYRERSSLPPEYPMGAPNYAEHRSPFAKQTGLGRGTSHTSGRRTAGKK